MYILGDLSQKRFAILEIGETIFYVARSTFYIAFGIFKEFYFPLLEVSSAFCLSGYQT